MENSKHNIKVRYSGTYPSLCYGRWYISIDGISLTCIGSDDYQADDFQTFNTYRFANFEEDKIYTDGLQLEEWIRKLKTDDINGLYASLNRHGIKIDDELLTELYYQIREWDWRSGECGGCL